jgi:hypothetical protein
MPRAQQRGEGERACAPETTEEAMTRRTSHKPQPPAEVPSDPALRAAEAERLRLELADHILRLRCSEPRTCAKGACRRKHACQRRANLERKQARAARAAAARAERGQFKATWRRAKRTL